MRGDSTSTLTERRTTARLALPALVSALRPYQWPKNTIVFAALAFSAGDAWHPDEPSSWWPLLWRTMALFVLWCLTASATYLVNDIRDAPADRLHPRKRFRPIAAGEVRPATAAVASAVLLVIALPTAFALDLRSGALLTGYAAVMLAYSRGLKHVAILDLLILSTGFVARAASGATAIDVAISPWLYICTGLGALFFATSKRWAEARELGADAAAHRPSLAQYSTELLGQLVTVTAATALLSYALYTIESTRVPANGAMALTIPFVGFALFRYLLLLHGTRRGDAPDRILFTDPQIQAAVAGFVLTAVIVLLAQ